MNYSVLGMPVFTVGERFVEWVSHLYIWSWVTQIPLSDDALFLLCCQI